jgi:hypothetical protein
VSEKEATARIRINKLLEVAIKNAFSVPVHFSTNLEPREGHDSVHRQLKDAEE